MADAEMFSLFFRRMDVDRDVRISASVRLYCRGVCLGVSWCKLAVSKGEKGWMVL
jgi:hypothetical protein